MPKMKTHKGLLKRVKITAKGRVKFRPVGTSHLNSGLTGEQMRKRRQQKYAKKGDVKRLSKMLHRPVRSIEYIEQAEADRARQQAAGEAK
jgi:large subunit ribosomal protein L35